MPPRKRTNTSKRTPPTSPTTSTSHAAPDHHHHLRHAGPSITTGTRTSTASSKPLPPETPVFEVRDEEKKPPAEDSAPARSSMRTFLYVLVSVALVFLGWYAYGMVTLLEKLKDEVGWWGVILGDTAAPRWDSLREWRFRAQPGAEAEADLEGSLNTLARALGISPVEVASAVRPLVPRASLTHAALQLRGAESGRSEAVRILFEDTTQDGRDGEGTARTAQESAEISNTGAA